MSKPPTRSKAGAPDQHAGPGHRLQPPRAVDGGVIGRHARRRGCGGSRPGRSRRRRAGRHRSGREAWRRPPPRRGAPAHSAQQRLQPARPRLGVVVEEDQRFAAGQRRTLVAGTRVAAVAGQGRRRPDRVAVAVEQLTGVASVEASSTTITSQSPRKVAEDGAEAALGQRRRVRARARRSRPLARSSRHLLEAVDRAGALVGDDGPVAAVEVLGAALRSGSATSGRSAARPGSWRRCSRSASRWPIASSLSAGWCPAQPPFSSWGKCVARGPLSSSRASSPRLTTSTVAPPPARPPSTASRRCSDSRS